MLPTNADGIYISTFASTATVSSVPVYDLVRVRYLIRILSNTMNAAGRVFVEGAYTP